jgi:hypothetical protein
MAQISIDKIWRLNSSQVSAYKVTVDGITFDVAASRPR